MTVDAPDIISYHSVISWCFPLSIEPRIVIERQVRGWSKVSEDSFRAALLESELCSAEHRATSAEDYFQLYVSVLSRLADEFAPVKRVTLRRQRVYWWTRICGQADQPRQLWCSLNTLMGASDKNRLLKNCPSAQQFADLFESKVAAVREATAGSSTTTELLPATEIFYQFQLCTASDVRSVIMGSSSKSCSLDPLPTDMLKKCLPELLPFITDLCNA